MRNKHLNLIAAASMAVGGIAFIGTPPGYGADEANSAKTAEQSKDRDKSANQNDKNAQNAEKGPVLIGVVTVIPLVVTDPVLPKGATFDPDISDAGDIRDTLAEVTEAALTKDGFNDIIERFVDMDRNRMDVDRDRLYGLNENDFQILNERITEFQNVWKNKYGQDFDIRENKVYAPLAFAQGRITDADRFMSQWPVDPTPLKPDDAAQPAGSGLLTERVKEQGNIENGREIAIVRLPSEFGLPVLNASFIDEAFGWKIDVSNTLSGRELHDNLVKHLTYLGDHVDQWPADVNEAYRAATHHVLMAIYGVEVPGNDGSKN